MSSYLIVTLGSTKHPTLINQMLKMLSASSIINDYWNKQLCLGEQICLLQGKRAVTYLIKNRLCRLKYNLFYLGNLKFPMQFLKGQTSCWHAGYISPRHVTELVLLHLLAKRKQTIAIVTAVTSIDPCTKTGEQPIPQFNFSK